MCVTLNSQTEYMYNIIVLKNDKRDIVLCKTHYSRVNEKWPLVICNQPFFSETRDTNNLRQHHYIIHLY